MTKLNKETAREKFRKVCGIKDVFSIQEQDPNYEYKLVDASTREGLGRIDRYIDAGWEVIYSKEKVKDDRATSANQDGKDEDLRVSPVTTTTRSGHTMIYTRCHKDQRAKNEALKHLRRVERFKQMQKTTKQKGNQLSVIGTDVDLNNLEEGN